MPLRLCAAFQSFAFYYDIEHFASVKVERRRRRLYYVSTVVFFKRGSLHGDLRLYLNLKHS